MDKNLIAERFSKAIGTYTREANIQQQIAEKMIHLLQQYLPPTPLGKVVEFGCGTGNYSRLLYHTLQPKQLLLNDICHDMQTCCEDLLNRGVGFLAGDAETLAFPEDTELITSCSTLQWFENPEHFFHRCTDYLSRNGYFAFTTFGQKNMEEIRSTTGHGLTYRSLRDLKASLAPMYDIIYAEEEVLPRTFTTPLQVLYHLKETGVTGTGKHHWTRRELNRFCEDYPRQSGNNHSVTLTYHPIYIIAKKKKQ
ncbi:MULTISPECIES: malonyl-ACP O-methyltransferase BioC [Bacteroides]|nr:malonyl-ACP O-methyltransferase BioC [Bacteroides nordii]MCE8465197.1 malonyl-ACP O-methyltransferase BioC [Bacteroides nordii]MCG4770882.1 malonyl-ACP O-methyltransferase BioC [Bacteroides nordii]UYU50765.1 malonyl-ACP O-methyltransferase BioC [Bacteroides nordii]